MHIMGSGAEPCTLSQIYKLLWHVLSRQPKHNLSCRKLEGATNMDDLRIVHTA